MTFLSIPAGHTVNLSLPGIHDHAAHVFENQQIDAINAALGAGRPLLIRGEPGIGKSQLARAAARVLGWAYLPFVADAKTESHDLLWRFDAVARLADAQARSGDFQGQGMAGQTLPIERYLTPGVLWWAFNWEDASAQALCAQVPHPPQPDGGNAERGCVVLIDEIDKADTDVPNGLLEALGIGQFSVRGRTEPICVNGKPFLVIITTNEERTLPDPFLRRCLVLHLALPDGEEKLTQHFVTIGQAHFDGKVADGIFEKAAQLVVAQRKKAASHHWRPLPGQAEYIDLLRSIVTQAEDGRGRQSELLHTVARYVLAKDPVAAHQWQPLP
ncbi:MAG: MoxR family ATPase [Nitrospirae bacterium]|nr:MoxR family ATPase [Magnetococcales bacterium]